MFAAAGEKGAAAEKFGCVHFSAFSRVNAAAAVGPAIPADLNTVKAAGPPVEGLLLTPKYS